LGIRRHPYHHDFEIVASSARQEARGIASYYAGGGVSGLDAAFGRMAKELTST
jgi:hypothetical protein